MFRRQCVAFKALTLSTSERRTIDLVLYVSSASSCSARAVANARRILRGYNAAAVSFTVCDLTENPSACERDQIAFTPTLCKRAPEPPMWILGDLGHPEPLLDLLEFYGVEPTHAHRKADDRHQRI
jgi:predicted metal-binding protein